MGKLLIKQRVFSWSDTYDIYDEAGNEKYFVKAEFFSIGHVIHVYRHNDESEIGTIRQKIFTFMPKFEIYINGNYNGQVRKEFTFFKPKYNVDYMGWNVEGDFFGWDYDIFDGGRNVAHISKELFHWGDTYVLHFERKEDEIMGLMLAIAIDAANCSSNNG